MKLFFYLFAVNFNKFDGSCNTADGPCARVFDPNKVKDINENYFI